MSTTEPGAALGAQPGSSATVEAAGSASKFVSMAPSRLLDTREESPGKLASRETVAVQVTGSRCNVPAGASAASLTLTVTEATSGGFLTLKPTGTPLIETSSLNWTTAVDTISNSALMELGTGGKVDIYALRSTHLMVDVAGYFMPVSSSRDGRYMPLEPRRLKDTRLSGDRPGPQSSLHIPRPSDVPSDAVAVSVTLTTTQSSGAGFFTVYPGGRLPNASSLNTDGAGQTRAAGQTVAMTPNGFDVFSSAGDHIIIDITGYFTGPSAVSSSTGLFVPTSAVRVLDTRLDGPQLFAGGTREIDPDVHTGGPVAAIAANWTITAPVVSGFVTAYPARTGLVEVSTLNTDAATTHTVANLGIVPTSTAGVAAYSLNGSHLVVDLTGWFTGNPMLTTTGVQRNGFEQPADPLARPTAPNSGGTCASGVQAEDLNSYFADERAGFYGADYQRAFKLPDGRVLWMFQDVFVRRSSGSLKLVHNVGLIQSGNCFSMLRAGSASDPDSWLLWDRTSDRNLWYWPMGGEANPDGKTFHLFMAEMDETGSSYLDHTIPRKMWVVDIRISDLQVTGYRLAPNSSTDLYGFDTASDEQWTYLYSHCYRQFGFTAFPGHDACSQFVKVARVPKGKLLAIPTYWNGNSWQSSPAAAVNVVDFSTSGEGINQPGVIWDGSHWRLILKADWWGKKVRFYKSTNPYGPWVADGEVDQPLKYNSSTCNTYYVSWIPWRNDNGSLIWAIGHNRWDGATSSIYRPTFHRH